MECIIKFTKNINKIIDKVPNFIKRNSECNKLNIRNTLYASALTLKYTGIANVSSRLNIENIINVSKNSIIKKRNNDTTHSCFKHINDNIINMIYNSNNNFINSYNF